MDLLSKIFGKPCIDTYRGKLTAKHCVLDVFPPSFRITITEGDGTLRLFTYNCPVGEIKILDKSYEINEQVEIRVKRSFFGETPYFPRKLRETRVA